MRSAIIIKDIIRFLLYKGGQDVKINFIKNKISKYTYCLEVFLAIFIMAAVVISTYDLVKYLILIFMTNPMDTYEVFQRFLGHVLLLVVGIELVIMLISHTTSSVLEVVLYAIARKMLIHSEKMLDVVIGVLAIGAVFAIRKYLFTKEIRIEGSGTVFSAGISVADANTITGLSIPETYGNTIGGVITRISEDTNRTIYEGIDFRIGNARLKVISMKDELIEKVLIDNLDE